MAATPDQWIQFQGILDRLRGDELPTGSLDQVFLAVRDREISVGIDVADIARLEPAVLQRRFRLLRTIPVALNTDGPRTSISPSSAMRTSMFGIVFPTVPMRWLIGVLTAMTGEVSVRP